MRAWFMPGISKQMIPQPGFVNQFIFKQGILVGEYAKKLYPGGIDLGKIGDLKEQLVKTFELLSEKKPLFEASCSFENVYSRADILVPGSYLKRPILQWK